MGWKKFNRAPTKRQPKKDWTQKELKMVSFVIKKGIKIAM